MAAAPPTSYNFADLWEWAADTFADRPAVVIGRQRRTYADLEERANRLANHLLEVGVEPDDRVALFLRNDAAYVEALFATFKVRAMPANVNFRYGPDELRQVLAIARPTAMVVHRSLAGVLAEAPDVLGGVRTVLVVDDQDLDPGEADALPPIPGGRPYEEVLSASSPERPVVEGRGDDDHYLMFTGGTTGLPKGVLWRMEDAFFACVGGGDPARLQGEVTSPAQVPERAVGAFTFFAIAPLMHAAAQWTTFMWMFAGGTVVLEPGSFDAEHVWQVVQDEKVNTLTAVGDVIVKPLVEALAANPGRWDLSSLIAVANGAAPLSPGTRDRLAELLPTVVLTDGIGSTETGIQGAGRRLPGDGGSGHLLVRLSETTAVLDDDLRPVEPGSGVEGQLATSGHIPLGYLDDPAKTAEVFVEVDGRRWVLNGDRAIVEADGTVLLLGRGSSCINTGGEKVFPEEVEGVLHNHPGVADVLVVGVPDDRWGSAVTAVVQPSDPSSPPSLDDLVAHARRSLAGYKLPKRLVVVDQVRRTPAGKADYRWAKEAADSPSG